MGGIGNVKLVGFDSDKGASMPIELALFDGDLLAEQMGEEAVGSFETIQSEVLTVDGSNTITLSYTPTTGETLTVRGAECGVYPPVYTEGNPATEADEYSIAGKVITFNTAVVEGSKIEVFYSVTAETNTVKYTSKTNVFSGTYKWVFEVEVADINDARYFGQITFFRGKLGGGFTMDFANTGDVAIHNAVVEALADYCNDELFQFLVYDEADLVTT